jgi:hypothetical protein
MKSAPFSYRAPTSVDEAVGLLGEFEGQGRVLAGGQSLLPLMNYRATKPKNLIDINPVNELNYIRVDDGGLTIGACVRQSALERSPDAAERAPLLVEPVCYVAAPFGPKSRHGRGQRRLCRPGFGAPGRRPGDGRRDVGYLTSFTSGPGNRSGSIFEDGCDDEFFRAVSVKHGPRSNRSVAPLHRPQFTTKTKIQGRTHDRLPH